MRATYACNTAAAVAVRTDQQRALDVAGDDVGLFPRARGLRPAALRAPLLDLRQLVDEEDALALRARRGLHDPHGVGVAPELLHEQRVVGGQQVGHRHEVQTARLGAAAAAAAGEGRVLCQVL
jgi:hypothetical protein